MKKQKNAVSKKTEKILMRMLDYIEKEPKRLDMNTWGEIYSKGAEVDENEQELPPCKTVACLAGTCLLVTRAGLDFLRESYVTKEHANSYHEGNIDFPSHTPDKAEEILGITDAQAKNLFYFADWRSDGYGWPMKFVEQYNKAKTARGRFQVTKRRVLHFIKTGE